MLLLHYYVYDPRWEWTILCYYKRFMFFLHHPFWLIAFEDKEDFWKIEKLCMQTRGMCRKVIRQQWRNGIKKDRKPHHAANIWYVLFNNKLIRYFWIPPPPPKSSLKDRKLFLSCLPPNIRMFRLFLRWLIETWPPRNFSPWLSHATPYCMYMYGQFEQFSETTKI
jgi:hypothetical protein